MVFTVRYTLGILLVLISCSAIHTASIHSRSARETQETEVPKNESFHVATTTEPPPTTQLNNATTTKTENSTNQEENVDNTTEATATVAYLVSATTNAELTTTEGEGTTTEINQKNGENTIKQRDGEEEETATVISKLQARTENGRSLDFDISKYTSPEFHNRNNVYNLPTSPENEKYVSVDFDHKATTAREFTRFTELTTPVSEYFDAKYHEVEQGVAQDLEDVDHFFNEEQTPKNSLNDILEKAKRNDSEVNLDFLKYTSVLSENKEGKNSVHKNFENEQRLKINFDSIYNHTKLTDEEVLVTSESPTVLTTTQSQEKVSFVTTTKRPLPTKFSLVNKTLDQSSLLSNKIETETIKPILLKHSDEESNSKDKSTEENISSETENGNEGSKSKDSNSETIENVIHSEIIKSNNINNSEITKNKNLEGVLIANNTNSNDETEIKNSTEGVSFVKSDNESKPKEEPQLDNKDGFNSNDSIDSKNTSDASNSELSAEGKSKIFNLVKPPSEDLKNSGDESSKDLFTKTKNSNNLNSEDSEKLSPELNRSPEENVINVSKRGSTKFAENDVEVPNPTIPTLKENNTQLVERDPTAASLKESDVIASDGNVMSNKSRDGNVEENNVYAFVATTYPTETTTVLNLSENTETLYEITDERFDLTTEAIVYNTKKARELATTMKTEPTSEEVFYEMTTETTTMPSVATEIDLGTEETVRFVTEADSTSTTEDTNLFTTTVPPEITTGGSTETRDSTAFDALVTEAITTESPVESTTLNISESVVEIFDLNEKTDKAITEENITTEVNSSTEDANIKSESTTEFIDETSTPASTTRSPLPKQKDLPASNKTDPTVASITTIDPEFEDDEDDEYIDFGHRKNNATSGNEEVDVLNPEVSEDASVKSTTINPATTVNSLQQPTTTSPVTTTIQEERAIVDEKTKKAAEVTTVEATTEHEDVTETLTEGSVLTEPEGSDGTVIAITISTIGAICLVLLAVLLFIMRRRQRKFNYGQRCTPVSLDSYSMDNVSVYNSVRRKTAIRDSKRSYGNPAFDDATVSHPLNFQTLVKYANSVDEIATEFEAIPMVTARMSELPEGCEVKNRYANVIPLPETRVVLSATEDDPTGDYINANFVTGPKGVRGYYIACQAPMNNTVNDFWRMIWEQQSKVILMLTHLYETGVEKCVDYLPPSEVLDCHRLFGDYQVTLKNREVKDKYIISSLQLKNMVTNSWREVTHFWYLGWPEKGVPSEENSIIAFLIEARSYVKLVQNSTDIKVKDTSNGGIMNQDVSPVVVHCSPGTGRTGTVIACDIAIREFELKRLVDIPRIVYRIRRDRASSVQTKDQYTFIYRVINLYATKLTGGALDSI